MTTNQTPLPTYKRQETRTNLSDVIGGTFENIFENLTGVPQSFEAKEPVATPVPEYVRKAFSTGEIRDFKKPKIDPEIRQQQVREELQKAQNYVVTKAPIDSKRIKINELNDLQVLYQGSVDSQGNVTAYHEANAEKKQVEILSRRIQEERKQKLAEAKGKTKVQDNFVKENDLINGEVKGWKDSPG